MKIQIEILLEYGIMFLHDPYGDVEFPQDTGAAPMTFTDSCIGFQVASYVDGNAHVTLSDNYYSEEIRPSFSKKVACLSKFISLTDVSVNYYAMLALRDSFAEINIWNFEFNGEEYSWVQIENLELLEAVE